MIEPEENPFPVGTRVQHSEWHDFGTVVEWEKREDCGSDCCTVSHPGWPVVQWDDEGSLAFQVYPKYLIKVN